MENPPNNVSQVILNNGKENVGNLLCCSGMVLDVSKLLTLTGVYEPLATAFGAPVLAGETLYPSVEHHVAAQLLRDVQRLDAVPYVCSQLSRTNLRKYLRDSLANIPGQQLDVWRRERMNRALKAATDLKFVQYAELKALLLQTGDALILEMRRDVENDVEDVDWSIALTTTQLHAWMKAEEISPISLAIFTMHSDFKPGVLGNNITGKLLMEMRREILNVEPTEFDIACPVCSSAKVAPPMSVANEIIILAGQSNPLTFDYPTTFTVDDKYFLNVEHYVKYKLLEEFGFADMFDTRLTELEQRKPSYFCKISDFLWDRRQHEIFGDRQCPTLKQLRQWSRSRGLIHYRTALMAKFRQNSYFRRALAFTGNALLIELRSGGKGSRWNFESTEYGAFTSCDPARFVTYAKQLKLEAQTLACHFTAMNRQPEPGPATSLLPGLGRNLLGILMMDIRQELGANPGDDNEILATHLRTFWANVAQENAVPSSADSSSKLRCIDSYLLNDHSPLISTDGRCNPLSIFYRAPFVADGLQFPTLEHYRWWKFFDYHSNVMERLPGFWDHLDGRQLRAVCEQWTNENMGLHAATLLEEYRSQTEYQILQSGASLKHSQNPHILPALFDGLIVTGATEGDEHLTIGISIGEFRYLVNRWKLDTENLINWWTTEKWLKPAVLGDNLLGLVLMNTRKELLAFYCSSIATQLPQIPSRSTSQFSRFASDKLYVFDDDTEFGWSKPLQVEGVDYSTVWQYFYAEFLTALQLEEFDDEMRHQPLEALRALSSQHLSSEQYAKWRQTGCTDLLRKIVRTQASQKESFELELLATNDTCLIYCPAGDQELFMDLLGAGMDSLTFKEMLQELRPPSTNALYCWLSDPNARINCFGCNLWSSCLMEYRHELSSQKAAQEPSIHESCFWNMTDVLEATDGKKLTKRYTGSEQERIVNRLITDASFGNTNGIGEDDVDEDALRILPPLSANTDSLEDQKSATANAPVIQALRLCMPAVEEAVIGSRNAEEAMQLGERAGAQLQAMLGRSTKVQNFTHEDFYNLGRIAACQIIDNKN